MSNANTLHVSHELWEAVDDYFVEHHTSGMLEVDDILLLLDEMGLIETLEAQSDCAPDVVQFLLTLWQLANECDGDVNEFAREYGQPGEYEVTDHMTVAQFVRIMRTAHHGKLVPPKLIRRFGRDC